MNRVLCTSKKFFNTVPYGWLVRKKIITIISRQAWGGAGSFSALKTAYMEERRGHISDMPFTNR